jgi:hypothetical protein
MHAVAEFFTQIIVELVWYGSRRLWRELTGREQIPEDPVKLRKRPK